MRIYNLIMKDLKMQFSNKSYEENITEYENILKEKMEFIDLMHNFIVGWIK